MSLLNQVYNRIRATIGTLASSGQNFQAMTPKQFYNMLKFYYLNNGLYDETMRAMYNLNIWTPGMKPLRNPAYRVVEFYVSKLWPGKLPNALPILSENKKITPAIQQVWTWSNWSQRKQLAVRWMALYGDMFIKVAQSDDRKKVFFQLIEPQYVTDFEADERDFLTNIRLDFPQMRNGKALTQTEFWTKERFRVWEHDKGEEESIDRLGSPKTDKLLSDFGIDFVPIVHAKLRDIGEDRGVGAFTLALDKVDEANVMVTRLHQMLFRHNKPHMAISANGMDASGRPLPPPRIGATGDADTDDDSVIELGDEKIFRLPGQSTIQFMVPPINYEAALSILNAHMDELEKDMPELAYYGLRDRTGEVSGKAVRLLLSDAIDRLLEAQGSAEEALAQADAMALTLGANAELELFKGIGDYNKGDFEHSFAERDVIGMTDQELFEQVKAAIDTGVPLVTALRDAGKSQEWIDQMMADKKAADEDKQTMLASALVNARRNFDQGEDDQV